MGEMTYAEDYVVLFVLAKGDEQLIGDLNDDMITQWNNMQPVKRNKKDLTYRKWIIFKIYS